MTASSSRYLRSMRRGGRVGLLRLHERLAARGPASVHLGWLVREERVIAVKRLHPLYIADEAGIARVRAEARIAMRVHHPNVVATLGVVHHPGELLAAMEYVPGASLAEIRVAVPGGVDPRIASAIAAGALRGTQAAHEARLCALPRPVSSLSSGRVLVGDDGWARIIHFDVSNGTAAAIVDDLPYASPEQLVRGPIDVRRDVYAASVILWETLTGRPLFQAATVEGMLRKILTDTVPAPSRFAPGISPQLDAIAMRGLARDPEKRFPSASAMASALEHTSCAAPAEVARALAAMNLAGVPRRRALADAVRWREKGVFCP